MLEFPTKFVLVPCGNMTPMELLGYEVRKHVPQESFRWVCSEASSYPLMLRSRKLIWNACVCDFLLENPELVDPYAGQWIPFIGSTFHDSKDNLFTTTLHKEDGKWIRMMQWAGYGRTIADNPVGKLLLSQ